MLKNVFSQDLIKQVRDECNRFMKEKDDEMDRKGIEVDEINHKGKRYFIAMRYKDSPIMQKMMFGKETEEITRAILGDNVYLFLEQFVVKASDTKMTFSWHQDSGYLDFEHTPYLSIWVPLDDVNEDNGTVYLLPYSEAGTKKRVEHTLQEGTNDMVGYFGDHPGYPAILNAGDVAIFSSTTFHRSGANLTDKPRRTLLIQFSPAPISKDGKNPLFWAEPFIQDGKRVKEVPTEV
jgi:ectoine hydroxylase-related dioxygenase (phytanoyl-CoA dioxygenase family)